MIGQLTGAVIRLDTDSFLLNVGGVGYEISATPRLLSQLEKDQEVTVAIETLVAETFIRLVGFSTEAERQTFRLLQTVQGVGAKAALNILQVLSPAGLLDAVVVGDKAAVSRAQGVGPKLALRVVTELKGKTGAIALAQDTSSFRQPEGQSSQPSVAPMPVPSTVPSARADALSALTALGYDEGTAHRIISDIPQADQEEVSALVTEALKRLAR